MTGRVWHYSIIELGSNMQGADFQTLSKLFRTEIDTKNLISVSLSLLAQNPHNNQDFDSIASENNVDPLSLKRFLISIGVLEDKDGINLNCETLKSLLNSHYKEG